MMPWQRWKLRLQEVLIFPKVKSYQCRDSDPSLSSEHLCAHWVGPQANGSPGGRAVASMAGLLLAVDVFAVAMAGPH